MTDENRRDLRRIKCETALEFLELNHAVQELRARLTVHQATAIEFAQAPTRELALALPPPREVAGLVQDLQDAHRRLRAAADSLKELGLTFPPHEGLKDPLSGHPAAIPGDEGE